MEDIFKKLESIRKDQVCDVAHDKFVQVYEMKFKQNGEAFWEEQKALFLEELLRGTYAGKFALPTTTTFSIYNAFMTLAIKGLSLEKNFTTQCYLECRSRKVGVNEKGTPIYGNMAVITITGYGEVLLRTRAKQIKGIDNPVIVYDCDDFAFGEKDGHKFINWLQCSPRPVGAKLSSCYIKIYKMDGSYDYFNMDLGEIQRLKKYSLKFNGGKYANPLYGMAPDCSDIDTGFLISKTIKHAFKNYPKLDLTDGAAMEADKDTDEAPMEKEQTFAQTVPTEGVRVETEEDSPIE